MKPQEQPTAGGSYVRDQDGKLTKHDVKEKPVTPKSVAKKKGAK